MVRELVERAQQGDQEAFALLATRASGRLHGSARLMLRHPDLADDAVQDTLVEAWRGIRGLRDPDRLDAWPRTRDAVPAPGSAGGSGPVGRGTHPGAVRRPVAGRLR